MEDGTENLYFSEDDVNGYPLQTRVSFIFYQNFNNSYRSFTCVLTDAVLYSMFMLMSVIYFDHEVAPMRSS